MALPVQHRWLPFVLPFLVYLAAGVVEPRPAAEPVRPPAASPQEQARPAKPGSRLTVSYRAYPLFYLARVAVTLAVAAWFLPVYRSLLQRPRALSLAVGTVGAVIWIGLARAGWEAAVLRAVGLENWLPSATRPSYDPFTALGDSPPMLWAFLAVRFFGLVCLVPLVEEFFLRGFLMRYVIDPDWWTIAVGRATPLAVAVGMMYGVVTHPGEALAAAVWFSLITWLVWKTRNIWDAVAAHALTNLLLGVYIIARGQWALW